MISAPQFADILVAILLISASVKPLSNRARSKISVSLPCVNQGDAVLSPRVLGEVPGIETEVIPAKVPPGERFSLVFSGKRKALQKLTGNHSYSLRVGESKAEACSITISIK